MKEKVPAIRQTCLAFFQTSCILTMKFKVKQDRWNRYGRYGIGRTTFQLKKGRKKIKNI